MIDQRVLDRLNPVYTIVTIDSCNGMDYIQRGSHGMIVDIDHDGVRIDVDLGNGRVLKGVYKVRQFLTQGYDQKTDMMLMKQIMEMHRDR